MTKFQVLKTVLNIFLIAGAICSCFSQSQDAWVGYGGNGEHTGDSSVGAQPLSQILWQASMDDSPPYNGNDLFIHYGSPVVTPNGTVVYPVRHADNSFSIIARNITTGAIIWSANTSYSFPSGYDWIPSFGMTLIQLPSANANTKNFAVCWPESGGRIAIRPYPDQPNRSVKILSFYPSYQYDADPSTYDSNVHICTPLTAGSNGRLYFGFQVSSSVPNNLQSGIAYMNLRGGGKWVSTTAASGDSSMTQVQFNCAPAITPDNSSIYIGVAQSNWSRGYLLRLDGTTLATTGSVVPIDPYANAPASILSSSTASPMIAPDGSVFYGVLENTFATNHDRGYMMHYSSDLTTTYTPGSFGWDDTASIVPSSIVSSYTGTSPYLIMCKYNNYAGYGNGSNVGNGVNEIAILDPNATEIDPYTNATVMNEVETLVGPTPNAYYRENGYPLAVYEWCINMAAIDIPNHSVLAGSEDGNLYRWNLDTDTITQTINLTAGIGEAYTPTIIAPGGQVLAINNAILFCIGGTTSMPNQTKKKSMVRQADSVVVNHVHLDLKAKSH